MLPDSIAALLALLALVAPGLVFDWTLEKSRPMRGESSFREISRIALASLAFTWLSVLALSLASTATRRLKPNVRIANMSEWAKGGSTYTADHAVLVAWTLTFEVALACTFAYAAATRMARQANKDSSSPITHSRPWYAAIQGSMTGDEAPWVLVTLTEGTCIWGHVDRYTIDQVPSDERQIALTGPGLAIEAPGGQLEDQGHWDFIVLDAANIALLKVQRNPRRKPDALT